MPPFRFVIIHEPLPSLVESVGGFASNLSNTSYSGISPRIILSKQDTPPIVQVDKCVLSESWVSLVLKLEGCVKKVWFGPRWTHAAVLKHLPPSISSAERSVLVAESLLTTSKRRPDSSRPCMRRDEAQRAAVRLERSPYWLGKLPRDWSNLRTLRTRCPFSGCRYITSATEDIVDVRVLRRTCNRVRSSSSGPE